MNEIYKERIDNVCKKMKSSGIDGLIVSDVKSIFYLTGINYNPYERLFVFYIGSNGKRIFFLNKLFNIHQNDFEEVWFSDTDDCIQILSDKIISSGTLGIDKTWTANFLLSLQEKNFQLHFVNGSFCVDEVRGCKDKYEQELMKTASRINDECMLKARSYIHEGITEQQLADYIDEQFLLAGADGNSFKTIVCFGKNAADPHHEPDETVLEEGNEILIDMGCIKDGYCSDMTRTFYYKNISEEQKKIYEIVKRANTEAEKLIKPGIPLCELDKTSRSIIENAGYGKFFTHRLGHFCGQTDHEAGDVSSINKTLCKEGMIFSIEPGIYLPGKAGVRIEDLVLVTENGVEILNKVSKEICLIE